MIRIVLRVAEVLIVLTALYVIAADSQGTAKLLRPALITMYIALSAGVLFVSGGLAHKLWKAAGSETGDSRANAYMRRQAEDQFGQFLMLAAVWIANWNPPARTYTTWFAFFYWFGMWCWFLSKLRFATFLDGDLRPGGGIWSWLRRIPSLLTKPVERGNVEAIKKLVGLVLHPTR